MTYIDLHPAKHASIGQQACGSPREQINELTPNYIHFLTSFGRPVWGMISEICDLSAFVGLLFFLSLPLGRERKKSKLIFHTSSAEVDLNRGFAHRRRE